jgi:3-methylcrotonyl-CoA carboxylase alpha subunit
MRGLQVWPIRTNAAFLRRCADHPDFRAANLDTGFIARNEHELIPADEATEAEWQAAAGFALADQPTEADYLPQGFRLNAPSTARVALSHAGETRVIERAASTVPIHSDFGTMMLASDDDSARAYSASVSDDEIVLFSEGRAIGFLRSVRGTGQASAADGAILAPMPGKVIAVDVVEGQAVTAGQRLMVLEAMKMEHALAAPFDGVVEGLSVIAGAQVQVEAVLVTVVPASTE